MLLLVSMFTYLVIFYYYMQSEEEIFIILADGRNTTQLLCEVRFIFNNSIH